MAPPVTWPPVAHGLSERISGPRPLMLDRMALRAASPTRPADARPAPQSTIEGYRP